MRIRTFTADSARDAIDRVRAEMGADAIIISMDEAANGRGVIVRAAMDGTATIAALPSEAGQTTSFEERLEGLLRARLRSWTTEPLAGVHA